MHSPTRAIKNKLKAPPENKICALLAHGPLDLSLRPRIILSAPAPQVKLEIEAVVGLGPGELGRLVSRAIAERCYI